MYAGSSDALHSAHSEELLRCTGLEARFYTEELNEKEEKRLHERDKIIGKFNQRCQDILQRSFAEFPVMLVRKPEEVAQNAYKSSTYLLQHGWKVSRRIGEILVGSFGPGSD